MTISGDIKYESTKRINALRGAPAVRVWQRNYYEHIIRDTLALSRTREYIFNNPRTRELDKLRPNTRSKW